MATPLEKGGQNQDVLKIQENSQNDHKVENSSAEKVDRMIRRDGQNMDSEKAEGGSQNGCKVPNRNACRKRRKRLIRSEAKAAAMEMRKYQLNSTEKLEAHVWLMKMEDTDIAEIDKFKNLLNSSGKQDTENGSQLTSHTMTIMYVETQVTIKESNASDGRLCTDEDDIVDTTMPCEEDSGTKFSAQSSHDVISENFNDQVDSKQNELAEEVNYLKSGLQLVRQDRDYQLAQVQSLMADIEKQKEIARRCAVEVDNAMKKVSALEEGCLSQRETIRTLQIQLASANEKLTELNCQERRDHDAEQLCCGKVGYMTFEI